MESFKLDKWSLNESLYGLLFFAQRICELLSHFSLDTYKPPTLNAPFFCKEALDLIKEIDRGLINEANLEIVLNELMWTIKNDKVSKSLLDAELNQYIQNTSKVTLSQKRLNLEVLQNTLEPYRYLKKCQFLLKEAITNGHKEKKKIDLLTRSLVTTLINIGFNKTFLYEKTKKYFFYDSDIKIVTIDQIDDFFKLIHPFHHQFEVFCIVSDHIKEISTSIAQFSIKIFDTLPKDFSSFQEAQNFKKNINEVFVKIENITDLDHISASNMADQRLDQVKDLFTLFYHSNKITWKDIKLIKQCCVTGLTIIGRSRNHMEIDSNINPRRASKDLNWLINNFSLKASSSREKFNRVVDLHGICTTTEIPENQLLNLWISLEMIVPSKIDTNKITNITKLIDPFIRLTYIKRLTDKALCDLISWDKFFTKKILKNIPNKNNSNRLSLISRLLRLLVLEDNKEILEELNLKLQDNQLLRFRLWELSEKLSTPKKIINLINYHSNRVSWQLHRIYRTRNLIIHSGKTPNYIGTLIENGHDYLDIILKEIMNLSCGSYRIYSIEQAFKIESIFLNKYEKKLNNLNFFNNENIDFIYHDPIHYDAI